MIDIQIYRYTNDTQICPCMHVCIFIGLHGMVAAALLQIVLHVSKTTKRVKKSKGEQGPDKE